MKYILLIASNLIMLITSVYGQTDSLNVPKPALPGAYADPHIAVFGKKFYIYPTSDGSEGWRASNFSC